MSFQWSLSEVCQRMVILYAYVLVALLIAVRLGWHMRAKLDDYDWHYNKTDIWVTFGFGCIAWPLLFIKPANLVDPNNLFRGGLVDFAARQRERDQLWNNPPPCGERIRYRQGHGRYEETYGEFILDAVDVESTLIDRLQKNPNLDEDDEGAILNWLRHRDDSISEPTDVPKAWWRFQYVADVLVRSGAGIVYCLQCDKEISKKQLVTDDDRGKPSWNFDRLVCPDGHKLLVVERVHLLVRQ